ncbi:RagB/SusD family nutrient uptake outer membrane protein [Pontibacter korlensis]|uniref:Starch-binding protein n=1 Tax=Pontibacter korlensis TaxID=400092 RepID=A0A0E3ZFR5_9BACT|nr:RagB/SusD family nutrient uptake outer membrane protein [Pontibacter korlensis]AKD03690.1 starch-binding protein [Pontibacter korlensis]
MNFFKTTYTSKLVFTALVIFSSSCSDDYLEEMTYGEISPSEMTSPGNVDRAIIAAYSLLNGQYDASSSAFNSPASNWSFGDVVSDDAYKGGGGTGDQNNIHLMEIFNTNPTIIDIERKWVALYEGVKRTNEAMRLLQNSQEYDVALKENRMGELYFLRGHYYFELKKIYNTIPYIDETAATVNDYAVSHTQYTSEQLWDKIEENFSNAYERLPNDQEEVGRPNKMTAKAYLAKTYIFQGQWQNALDAANEVINSNKYSLLPNFRDVFLPENDNSSEIIFAVQHSVLDGAPDNYNGSIGDRLSAPGGPFYSQYGFHRPSQNLVNAYKTNAIGMPVLDNKNLAEADFVDPRLDHTVGRPGIPYLDLGVLYEASWARDLSTYGPFAPKKRIVSANSPYQIKTWPYISALNYYIIRYADLLLWKAEALVELGDLEGARAVVNQVRGRAKDSQYVMNLEGTTPAASYRIETYNTPWTDQATAREAVRTERRLELALEGHRFFDLVRWGVAAETINAYLEVEKTRRTHLTNANFIEGTHNYFPVPQKYLDYLASTK